jgi:hypothetical protein
MAVLANISVVVADLVAIRPDLLTAFQYDSESDDFAEEITRGKQTLYRMVKDAERVNQPSLTEAELTALLVKVKDISDVGYLKERLVLLILSEIMKASDMLDQSRMYADDAERISLIYYIDEDGDSVIDEDEERSISGVTLGR